MFLLSPLDSSVGILRLVMLYVVLVRAAEQEAGGTSSSYFLRPTTQRDFHTYEGKTADEQKC